MVSFSFKCSLITKLKKKINVAWRKLNMYNQVSLISCRQTVRFKILFRLVNLPFNNLFKCFKEKCRTKESISVFFLFFKSSTAVNINQKERNSQNTWKLPSWKVQPIYKVNSYFPVQQAFKRHAVTFTSLFQPRDFPQRKKISSAV